MLSQKQKQKYVKSAGARCPYCNSDDIEAGKLEADGSSAWCGVECHSCGKEWSDVYALTTIEEGRI